MTPSREEIIAYATEVAKRNGLDPEVFLAVINGESGFNPAALGDHGKSHGLAQLYMDGGEGNIYEQRYGEPPTDPGKWMRDLDFMGERVATGGQGYGPWHAAKNAGIGQFQGVPGHNKPGTPGSPGPRDRGVANATAFAQYDTGGGGDSLAEMFGMTPEEMRDHFDPRGPQTLGAAFGDMVGVNDPNARQSERTHTLFGALGKGLGKLSPDKPTSPELEKVAKAEAEHYNPGSPMSVEAQLEANKKKKNLGSTVFSSLTGQTPAAGSSKSLLGGLFGMFG